MRGLVPKRLCLFQQSLVVGLILVNTVFSLTLFFIILFL